MGHDDFTYSIPDDFERRVNQILQQVHNNSGLAKAFKECRYEYEDLGNAYYAGIKGDNWNMDALDFTIEGPARSIEVLEKKQRRSEGCNLKGAEVKDVWPAGS